MLTLSLIIFGVILIAAAVSLVRIVRIERIYTEMFGEDETIPTWQRKRWAFSLLVLAHVVGFSRLVWPWPYASLIYLAIVCVAFWLFADAYRLLLKDTKRLRRVK